LPDTPWNVSILRTLALRSIWSTRTYRRDHSDSGGASHRVGWFVTSAIAS
jgi:hypothetical protein